VRRCALEHSVCIQWFYSLVDSGEPQKDDLGNRGYFYTIWVAALWGAVLAELLNLSVTWIYPWIRELQCRQYQMLWALGCDLVVAAFVLGFFLVLSFGLSMFFVPKLFRVARALDSDVPSPVSRLRSLWKRLKLTKRKD
jgi:hypothetical protein